MEGALTEAEGKLRRRLACIGPGVSDEYSWLSVGRTRELLDALERARAERDALRDELEQAEARFRSFVDWYQRGGRGSLP